MGTTTSGFRELLDRANEATRLLQRSEIVPGAVAELIDGLESTLGAAAPLRSDADPYLMAALWAAAFRAEKALRHDNTTDRRRDVRIALEQFRHALRDITEAQPYGDDTPARDVLARTVETVAAPQKTLAELLGVSVRQLQRWLADDGPEPAADDAARIRVVGQVVNQLRHSLTGPGTVAWFYRKHPVLGRRPVELLADPLAYPQLFGVAGAVRAQTA